MMEDLNGAAEAVADDIVMSEEDDATNLEDTSYDPAAEALEEEISGQPPKPRRRSPQERIDEITRARREAERERDYWREAAAQVLHEPLDADAYEAGFDPYEAQTTGHERFLELNAEIERRVEAEVVERGWSTRQADFARVQPDYYEVLHGAWPCSAPMADAIRTSEAGAEVAYHLASNPDEARRIAAMTPLAQVREIGRLEARVGRGAGAGQTRAVSGAPSPAPLGRGGGGRFKIDPATSDFAAFERQYGG